VYRRIGNEPYRDGVAAGEARRRAEEPAPGGTVGEPSPTPESPAPEHASFPYVLRSLATTGTGAGELTAGVAEAIAAERGSGTPLPEPVRADMEQHLGADMSATRVHTDLARTS
jgi:uncharacterized protein DUF4157